MSQDEELVSEIDQLFGTRGMTQEQLKQAIQDHYRTREATLIREARIDELKHIPNHTAVNLHVRNRITELTNQQKGEQ